MAIDPTDLESYFLERVNETRAANGALPLTFDDDLMESAAAHNEWMDANDTVSHTGADGKYIMPRIRDAGYDGPYVDEAIWFGRGGDPVTGVPAGENMASVDRSHRWYVQSKEGHFEAMINPNFQHIGISFIEGDYEGRPAAFSTLAYGGDGAEAAPKPLPGATLIDPDEYWERRGDEPRPDLTPVEPPPPHHPRPPSPCDLYGLCDGPIFVG